MRLLLLLVLTGCTTTITLPNEPERPVTVYISDSGRHASLFLPEPATGELIEFTYGEWLWFAENDTGCVRSVPTIFWPTEGTLGRRALGMKADTEAVRARFVNDRILPLTVGRGEAAKLFGELQAWFDAHRDTLHYQPVYETEFVRVEESFHAFHNCNHELRDWLRKLGCHVRGTVLWADYRLRDSG